MIKHKPILKFRIVKCGEDFYVQRRHWFEWRTQSGYHRGASGLYAYQFCTAANPYALIENTIPSILHEFIQPTLSKSHVRLMYLERPRELKHIEGVVDLERATQQLEAHKATNPPVTDFIPPGGVPYEMGL